MRACAGEVLTWGANDLGQLGDAALPESLGRVGRVRRVPLVRVRLVKSPASTSREDPPCAPEASAEDRRLPQRIFQQASRGNALPIPNAHAYAWKLANLAVGATEGALVTFYSSGSIGVGQTCARNGTRVCLSLG